MDGRSTTLLIAATLAATALTGCIANPLQALRAEVEVSAFENKAAADDAAYAWNPKAQLVGVMTFELSETMDPRIEADPSVGNGLAPAWWYVYSATEAPVPQPEPQPEPQPPVGAAAAGGKESAKSVQSLRAFKVLANGNVTSEEDAAMMAEGFEHDASPLTSWEIDSTAMIASAKQNEGFRKVAEGVNATVIEGVADHEGRTAWFASAMSAEGWVSAVLDAKTGEIIHIEEMTMDFAMPTFEFGATGPQGWLAEPIHLEGEGVSNAGDEFAEHPFTLVDEMHGTLMIEFSADFPMDGLHWAILDREGELVEVDHLGAWNGGGSYERELEIEKRGDYTFVIGYMSSAPFPGGGPIGIPLGGAVEYAFTLDLMPGPMPDHDEDEG